MWSFIGIEEQLWPIKTRYAKLGNSFIMHQGSVKERSFAMEAFFHNKRALWSQDASRTHFNLTACATLPNNRPISKWITVLSQNPSTRVPTLVTPESVDRVWVSVEESLERSTRRRVLTLEISSTSLRKIMKKAFNVSSLKDYDCAENPFVWPCPMHAI